MFLRDINHLKIMIDPDFWFEQDNSSNYPNEEDKHYRKLMKGLISLSGKAEQPEKYKKNKTRHSENMKSPHRKTSECVFRVLQNRTKPHAQSENHFFIWVQIIFFSRWDKFPNSIIFP